jgi:DNA-binding IclR family transcriptional regulator
VELKMIQVLARGFAILEELSSKGLASLKELAGVTGLKKSTLCNILRTLSDLGYVMKTERGSYRLGPKLGEIARPQLQQDALARLGREAVLALADATGEAAQLAVLREGERYILAEGRSRQGLIVNTVVLGITAVGSATGRVMLACEDEAALKEALRRAQATGGATGESLSELEEALEKIRKDGLSEYHPRDREVAALGVPVFCGTEVVAALGVYLPSVRFRGRHRKEVIELLKRAGKEMSLRLSAEVGQPALRPVETDQSFRT